MSPALLRRIGESLYGPRWQSDIARALGVADRTIRAWAAGEREMPPRLGLELLQSIEGRIAVLRTLQTELEGALQ